ncbi:hypothetical protein STEG23_029112 [Scotinomys teguina]
MGAPTAFGASQPHTDNGPRRVTSPRRGYDVSTPKVTVWAQLTLDCNQKYAHTSAKHFFKCPQCNNREEFPREMLRMGVHIPDRDAAWELEPGAFSELYQRYQHCDAPICLYEQGRDSFEAEGFDGQDMSCSAAQADLELTAA